MQASQLVIHILTLRERGDRAARQLAEEAATAVRSFGATAVLVEGAADAAGADALLVVAPQGCDVTPLGEGDTLAGRAAAVLCVGEEAREGVALCTLARRALQRRGALVIARQMVVAPSALTVYGLAGELEQEKLQALVHLLLVEADRLKAKRDGWEEPEAKG